MIFESHAHYNDRKFDEDRDEVIESLAGYGVGRVINVGDTLESSAECIRLAERYDFIYAAVGVHPESVRDMVEDESASATDTDRLNTGEQTADVMNDTEDDTSYRVLTERLRSTGYINTLRQQALSCDRVVSIGEIGLDYYWEKDDRYRKLQQEVFLQQMELASELKLPVIIHSRDACKDTLDIIARSPFAEGKLTGVMHCYSYSPEVAAELVRKYGMYIGVGGVVTFKNSKNLRETVEKIPIDNILVETDCPYMAPEPYRGKRNFSGYLPYVVEKIAEIKGITTDEVERKTYENGCRLFGVS
ncbi:MAG: TatD family hydrolase [Lachnospiraceae bacterium]|nr:TatD family hydrolase [Lachnospiraceae bacterium]